jgi:preprotein translocase subunit SecA
MPSVFGKSNLRYNHKDNFIVVSREEYWSRIRKEIDTQLQGSNGVKNTRAVLVIFEHEKALKEFQLSVHCQEIRSQIKIIAESSGIEQAAQIIKLSTRQGSITLMTRNFGRGTDFSCKDDRVNNQGGVAIIQTFLSESQSEDA